MGVICSCHPYGTHIGLMCPTCRTKYSTKNIDYIGARSVLPARGYTSCECGTELVHECTGTVSWLDFDQELAMFRRQGRTSSDVNRILERNYGSKLGKELGKRYEGSFAKISPEKAGEVEKMLYESREGFSPNPDVAREQARFLIESIARDIEEGK